MAKREFVQLAHKLRPKKDGIGGWFFSEKLDGHRCYWDGGVSRGMNKINVPWANNDKDERFLETQVATGLWSRYGNVIHAPDWFLNDLPRCPLDGELWSRSLTRQQISSIIKSLDSGNRWEAIYYNVFDIPPYEATFEPGLIDNINFKKVITGDCMNLVKQHIAGTKMHYVPPRNLRYESAYMILDTLLNFKPGFKALPFKSEHARRVEQTQLPLPQNTAVEILEGWTDQFVKAGGEGSMIRDPNAIYMCERSRKLLKVKPADDMEGTVIGYITGRKTDKGSRLLGKMGAMVLTLDDGKRLELSGFTDEERVLVVNDYDPFSTAMSDADKLYNAKSFAEANPETECPDWIEATHFPRGTRVSFKFRGLSDDGIPQEARYWRKDERL